jgi:hypothetical protein
MRRRAMELREGRIHNLQELKRCVTGDLLSNVATGWGKTRGDATGKSPCCAVQNDQDGCKYRIMSL